MQELIEKSKKTDPYFVISDIAKKNGYQMYVFDKDSNFIGFKKSDIRISVSLNRMKVSSVLTHPKKGRKLLTRGTMTIEEVTKIFENPRIHTGKGYYSKKDLEKYGGNKGW